MLLEMRYVGMCKEDNIRPQSLVHVSLTPTMPYINQTIQFLQRKLNNEKRTEYCNEMTRPRAYFSLKQNENKTKKKKTKLATHSRNEPIFYYLLSVFFLFTTLRHFFSVHSTSASSHSLCLYTVKICMN